jgi:hypothetical protein
VNAELAGTAALLDSPLTISAKLDLVERLSERIDAEGDKVPIVGPAFEPLPTDPEQRAQLVALRVRIEDEVDRAATHAFSGAFLVAAAFALASLLPIRLSRGEVEL